MNHKTIPDLDSRFRGNDRGEDGNGRLGDGNDRGEDGNGRLGDGNDRLGNGNDMVD